MRRLFNLLFVSVLVLSACSAGDVADLLPSESPVTSNTPPASAAPTVTAAAGTGPVVPAVAGLFPTFTEAFDILLKRHVDRPDAARLAASARSGLVAHLSKLDVSSNDLPAATDAASARSAITWAAVQTGVVPAAAEEAAIQGMVKDLADCHTYYLSPERATNFNKPLVNYSGIGAGITGGGPTKPPQFSYIFPGSPAEKIGLRAGDQVKFVDGVEVTSFTSEEVATLIRGVEGSIVNLVIIRSGDTLTFSITRARIQPPHSTVRLLDGSIGYVWLAAFNGDAAGEVSRGVKTLLGQGAKGIILDLRNNPGGDLSAALDVAGIFSKDTVLVYQTDREGNRQAVKSTSAFALASPPPMVVLVNAQSASGSEIVAAGLRASGVARVVGTRSAGCVGVASPRQLGNGGLLLVTLSRMQDAKTGENLNGDGRGVVPDFIVPLSPDQSADLQVDAAIGLLTK